MPAFVKSGENLHVDLGNGRDINLKLKPIGVETRRKLQKDTSLYTLITGRIENLTKLAQDTDTTPEEADKLFTEIEQLQSQTDLEAIAYSTICARGESWDYYATEQDFNEKKAIPLTVEALREQGDPNDLTQVFLALIDYYKENKAEGNGSTPTSSPHTSQAAASSAIQTDSIS